jgi:uncharacterized membrane protein
MVMRGILALFFAGAGFAHLLAPHELLKITPDWVPFASAVIFVTGFVELACAAALLTQSLRYWAGIALAIYSLCVWPANFKHALEKFRSPTSHPLGSTTVRDWQCSRLLYGGHYSARA